MHRLIVLGLSAVALASAATVRAADPTSTPQATPATQAVTIAASAPEAKKQSCWKEYRVGSSFPVTHCETAEDANDPEAKQRLREAQDNIMRNHAATVRAPGGN